MSDDETERSIPDENAEPYYHDGSDSSSISDHQTRRAILIVSDDNEDDEDDETPPKRSTFDDTPPPPPFSVDYSTSKKKEEEEKEDEWSPPLSADESPPLYNGMSPFSIASQRITQLQQRARAGSTESENSGASGRVRGIVSALQSRTGTPGSGWGWGSGVEPTSDDEERVRVRDEAAQDDGWGSVESASDAGEDDSWGSVEPASDADEEAVGEGQTEYEGESEDTGVGSEEEEEEDEDVVPLGFNEDGDYDEDEGVVPLGFDEDGDEKMDAWEDSPPLPERRIMRKRVVAKLLDSPQAAEKSAFIRAAHEKYEEEDRLLNTKAAFRLNHVPGRRRSTQKNSFTKKYVELLNDDILDAIGRDGYVDTNRTEESFEIVCGSAVLGSHWSRSEKEVFFNNLTVLGKDRVDEVAKAVGTKSVIECRAYILELEAAVKPIYKGMKKVGMDKIPAAVEVSCLCAEALERQAYHVERRKRIDEERMEKERWGVSWLIDTDLAEHIDMLIKDGDVDAIEDIAPDAELLNVKNMLQLSERVFMNGPGDLNYRMVAEDGALPSMRYSALMDIRELVISFTRRLIQTSIFMTESRLRSMEKSIFTPKSHIRADDISAALECLNLPTVPREYWVGLPRRAKLVIIERHGDHFSKVPKLMSHETAEEFLKTIPKDLLRFKEKKRLYKESGAEELDYGSDAEAALSGWANADEGDRDSLASFIDDDMDDHDLDGLQDLETEPVSETPASDTGLTPDEEILRKQGLEEDRYLGELDARASRMAEKELWRVMGFEGKDEDEEEEEIKPPRTLGNNQQRVQDWRNGLEYRAPWEEGERKQQAWEMADFLDYQELARKEVEAIGMPPRKRRRVHRSAKRMRDEMEVGEEMEIEEEEEEEEEEVYESPPEIPTKQKKGKAEKQMDMKKRKAEAKISRSKRARRQSAILPGFVSTVDAVSDAEAFVGLEEAAEEESDDVYDGGQE